jgi:DNA-binding response OmpR family regulator
LREAARAELAAVLPLPVGPAPAPAPLVFGDLTIDLRACTVAVAGVPVALTAREFDLLAFLARHPGRAFGRRDLLEHVWGSQHHGPATATVTEHVRRLWTKVGARLRGRRLITTLRGVGYRFDGGGAR